jgi:hypothetical protein
MAWRRYPWLPEDPPPPEPEDGWLPGEVLWWVEDEPPPSKRAVVDVEQILDALIRFKQTQPGGRREACKAVAKEFGIAATHVNELYGNVPEELRRPGRPRRDNSDHLGENATR